MYFCSLLSAILVFDSNVQHIMLHRRDRLVVRTPILLRSLWDRLVGTQVRVLVSVATFYYILVSK